MSTFDRRGFRITETVKADGPNAVVVTWNWRAEINGQPGPRTLDATAPDSETAILALCDAFDKIVQTPEVEPPPPPFDPNSGQLVTLPGEPVAGLDPWVFFAGSAMQALVPLSGMMGAKKGGERPEKWVADLAELYANEMYNRYVRRIAPPEPPPSEPDPYGEDWRRHL